MSRRVLMVIHQYHPVVGGAEMQARRLAEAMARRGTDVRVLTGRSPGTAREETIGGVPVRRVGYLAGLRIGRLKFRAEIAGMVSVMKRWRDSYDVIHAHQGHWAAYAATVAARKFGKPCVVKIANAGERFDLRTLASYLRRGASMGKYMLSHVSRFVATSQGIESDLMACGLARERIARIPNGVEVPPDDRARRAHCRQSLNLPDHAYVVLFVARLEEHKRPLLALEAFRKLHQEMPESRMVFLGDGSLREALSARVMERGLGDAVDVKGGVANVQDYMAAADAFVLPSDVEGLSNALLEAMAYGLACVATDVSGNVDLIRDRDTGLLVPPRDSDAVGNALLELARDQGLRQRLGQTARSLIVSDYALDRVVDQYLDLYDSVAG